MSRAAADPRTWRELRVRLQRLGARKVRTSGSHEIWRFRDGYSFVVVRNHLCDSVPVGILVKFRRQCARYRAIENEDPPPRWRGRGHGGHVLAERKETIWRKVVVAAVRAPVPRARAARKAVGQATARVAQALGRAPALAGTGPPRVLGRHRVPVEATLRPQSKRPE
jgi:predicted RNA binding protein YcfA (HicA-like mRNA interferase family)